MLRKQRRQQQLRLKKQKPKQKDAQKECERKRKLLLCIFNRGLSAIFHFMETFALLTYARIGFSLCRWIKQWIFNVGQGEPSPSLPRLQWALNKARTTNSPGQLANGLNVFYRRLHRLPYEIETLWSAACPPHLSNRPPLSLLCVRLLCLSHLLSLISWVLFLCPGIVLTLATASAQAQARPRRRRRPSLK